MTTQLTISTKDAATNILAAATDAGDPLLKFKKGDYRIRDEIVPLGTQFLAHPGSWVKAWVKFVDGIVIDRRLYRQAAGEQPAKREEIDDLDPAKWPNGNDGKPLDPWVLQDYLPLQNIKTDEVVVFVTQSVGGRIAVAKLCSAWAKREKSGQHGQPIVKLSTAELNTKNFGSVPRPYFEICNWEEGAKPNPDQGELVAATPVQPNSKKKAAAVSKHADMDDEIPF
jgi:hypothetical protein